SRTCDTVSYMRYGVRNGTDETARVMGGMLSAVSMVACGWRDYMVPVRSQSRMPAHKSKLLANHNHSQSCPRSKYGVCSMAAPLTGSDAASRRALSPGAGPLLEPRPH